MNVYYDFENLPPINSSVVSVGSFDGVHRGHRLLIEQVRQQASLLEALPIVVTFDPHPRLVLKGENHLLSTLDEKLLLLAETGIENVVVIHFTEEFSKISHEDFIETFLIGKLHAQEIVSGDSLHFGHSRQGNERTIAEHGIENCHLGRIDNISSTAIRQAIQSGDMTQATRLLGGGYLIKGPVTDPTKLLPPDGKYLTDNDEIIDISKNYLYENTFVLRIIDQI